MKKILIFGCSFSAGSYELLSSDNELYVKNRRTDIIIKDSKGWYHFVDYFNDKDVTVIVCPGQGYWSWYQLLLMMDATNQLNFDEIWIQETTEPRVSLIDLKSIELNWNCIDIIDGIKRHYINNLQIENKQSVITTQYYRPSQDVHELEPKLFKLGLTFSEKHKHLARLELTYLGYGFFENVTPKIAELFQELCIKRNINGYVWSMAHSIMNCTKFTRLLVGYVKIELGKNNLLCGYQGHQTEEGNKYIGELINKACIDMKI